MSETEREETDREGESGAEDSDVRGLVVPRKVHAGGARLRPAVHLLWVKNLVVKPSWSKPVVDSPKVHADGAGRL